MNKLKLTISARAVEDLSDIWGHIALDSVKAADSFVEKLHRECQRLAQTPELGRPRDELIAGLRSLSHKGYVIFYTIGKKDLAIIRVLNGCMDIDSMF